MSIRARRGGQAKKKANGRPTAIRLCQSRVWGLHEPGARRIKILMRRASWGGADSWFHSKGEDQWQGNP